MLFNEFLTEKEVYDYILYNMMIETERNSFLNWMYVINDYIKENKIRKLSLDTFLGIINDHIRYSIATREILLGSELQAVTEDDFNLTPELFKEKYENM